LVAGVKKTGHGIGGQIVALLNFLGGNADRVGQLGRPALKFGENLAEFAQFLLNPNAGFGFAIGEAVTVAKRERHEDG
jgi:hypothetical protein